jgi:spore germination cell wall hydrolase CwlJ-like protein
MRSKAVSYIGLVLALVLVEPALAKTHKKHKATEHHHYHHHKAAHHKTHAKVHAKAKGKAKSQHHTAKITNIQPAVNTAGYAGRSCRNRTDEKTCMLCAIVFEAGNQSMRGKLAVRQVIENRAASHVYPSTICGNVHLASAFSFNKNQRLPGGQVLADAMAAANAKLTTDIIPHGATNYYANYIDAPTWAQGRCRFVDQIQVHKFYRCPGIINDAEIAAYKAKHGEGEVQVAKNIPVPTARPDIELAAVEKEKLQSVSPSHEVTPASGYAAVEELMYGADSNQ